MSAANLRDAPRRYSYRVVTMNGHGVHSNLLADVDEAKRLAKRLAQRERDHRVKLGPYEVERIEHVTLGHDWPRRYWMRSRRWWFPWGRWVPWSWAVDEAARRPDWIYA